MRLVPALLLLIPLCLAACSERDTPRPARVLEAIPSHADFGALRVHYNVLPTLAMNPAVASSYGVTRSADQALLVVALREILGSDESSLDGHITATATDLSGRRQQVTLRPIRTGAYIDHVGAVQISNHDTLRFVLQIQTEQRSGTVRFERNF